MEKGQYHAPATNAAAPPYGQQQQQQWNPSAQPNEHLGTYHPSADGMTNRQPSATNQMQATGPGPNPLAFPSATYCPATGGAHEPRESFGMIGIIVGILFCPCGLIALCMDKKITCTRCQYLIQPSWGQ